MMGQLDTTSNRGRIAQAHAELPTGDDPAAPSGWDHLLRAILEDPGARVSSEGRRQGIELLTDALLTLELREATVLMLRYGISPDDQPGPTCSPQMVSEQLQVSPGQVASLERCALAALRAVLRPAAAADLERFAPARRRRPYTIGLN
jgi:DNA-directed RNA polymerase sigma subunit (sigma70/sigma32)